MARLIKTKHARSVIPGIACIILATMLCSCVDLPADTHTAGTVRISPDVTVVMPDPASLGRSVEASQLVTAHYGAQNFTFNARISATPERFLMVGLDMMGRKMMTIDWTKDGIGYEAMPWVPPQLKPENILADMVLLYWPEDIVRHSLAASFARLVTHPHSRTIMFGNKTVLKASYHMSPKSDLWSGTLHYRNLSWGYAFDVQSVEVVP